MDWKLHAKQHVYNGHFSVSKYELSHTRFVGGHTPILTREVISRNDAVALVPYDPVTDKVVLIEQFRIGAIREKRPWLVEIVAGLLEEGEQPEEVALRETQEEIGCTARHVLKVGEFYTSPGGSTEWVQLYAGCVSIQDVQKIGGLEHEGEDIKVHIVDANDIPLMISTGEVRSAIAIIGLQWFVANRDFLKTEWKKQST